MASFKRPLQPRSPEVSRKGHLHPGPSSRGDGVGEETPAGTQAAAATHLVVTVVLVLVPVPTLQGAHLGVPAHPQL